MPYNIEPADGGFFVMGPSGPKSKRPLTKMMAKKQKTALDIAMAREAGHRIPPPTISMPVGEFRKEHKRLVKTLEEGSKAKLRAEAHRQAMELRERLG